MFILNSLEHPTLEYSTFKSSNTLSLQARSNTQQQVPGLFLDRDGVINVRTPDDYILDWSGFRFLPGVLEALPVLARLFDPIVVVTNQAGISKGRMSHEAVQEIHRQMRATVQAAGGRIDAVYYCPERDHNAPCRKPNPGMAHQAQADFPHLDFSSAWIVGDSASDLDFGSRLGMKTALVEGKTEENYLFEKMTMDWRGASLLAFAEWLSGAK